MVKPRSINATIWISNTISENDMADQKFLLVKARNLTTGQTVKNQDLTGERFTLRQRALAENSAEQLAEKMSKRTGEPWVGFLEEYIPSVRRS